MAPQTKTPRGRLSKRKKIIGLFLLRQRSLGLSGDPTDYLFVAEKPSGSLDWGRNQLMLMGLFLT